MLECNSTPRVLTVGGDEQCVTRFHWFTTGEEGGQFPFNIHSPQWFNSACKCSVVLALQARQMMGYNSATTSLQRCSYSHSTADEALDIDITHLNMHSSARAAPLVNKPLPYKISVGHMQVTKQAVTQFTKQNMNTKVGLSSVVHCQCTISQQGNVMTR